MERLECKGCERVYLPGPSKCPKCGRHSALSAYTDKPLSPVSEPPIPAEAPTLPELQEAHNEESDYG